MRVPAPRTRHLVSAAMIAISAGCLFATSGCVPHSRRMLSIQGRNPSSHTLNQTPARQSFDEQLSQEIIQAAEEQGFHAEGLQFRQEVGYAVLTGRVSNHLERAEIAAIAARVARQPSIDNQLTTHGSVSANSFAETNIRRTEDVAGRVTLRSLDIRQAAQESESPLAKPGNALVSFVRNRAQALRDLEDPFLLSSLGRADKSTSPTVSDSDSPPGRVSLSRQDGNDIWSTSDQTAGAGQGTEGTNSDDVQPPSQLERLRAAVENYDGHSHPPLTDATFVDDVIIGHSTVDVPPVDGGILSDRRLVRAGELAHTDLIGTTLPLSSTSKASILDERAPRPGDRRIANDFSARSPRTVPNADHSPRIHSNAGALVGDQRKPGQASAEPTVRPPSTSFLPVPSIERLTELAQAVQTVDEAVAPAPPIEPDSAGESSVEPVLELTTLKPIDWNLKPETAKKDKSLPISSNLLMGLGITVVCLLLLYRRRRAVVIRK